jgi:hypothetical protein
LKNRPVINSRIVNTYTVLILSCLLLIQTSLDYLETFADSVIIHGGGSGSIECIDGSQAPSDIAFIVLVVNGSASGNWTLDNFNDPVNPGTVLSKGTIYSGNASISQNDMIGDTHNIKEEIKLCNPPLFTPISLTGVCGQNVVITVQLRSNNPLGIEDTFNGDVICNSTAQESMQSATTG